MYLGDPKRRGANGGLVLEGESALIMVTGCVVGVCLLASRMVEPNCGDGCCRALVNGSSIPNRSSIFGLLGTVGMADFC